MRDPKLFSLWQGCFQNALKSVSPDASSHRTRSRLTRKVEEELLSQIESSEIANHLLQEYSFNVRQGSKSVSENVTVAEQVQELIWKYYFRPFASYYLQEVGRYEFNDEVFDRIYEALEEQLYTGNEPPDVFFAPLFNFRLDSETEINFEDYLSIRPMTLTEKNLARRFLKNHILEKEFKKLKFAICYLVDKTNKKSVSEYDSVDVLTVMRLLKQEPIQAPFTLTYPARPVFGKSITEMMIQEVGEVLLVGKTYFMTEKDVQQVLATWHKYRVSKAIQKYAIAFNKFEDVYKRVYATDKIIDCWVGLENLYLRGIRDELRYRASIRIAYFLGSSYGERQRLYKEAKDSYDIRSTLVHGGKVTERSIKLTSLIALSHLRDSLRLVLDSEKARLLGDIDNVIIKG